MKKIIVVMLVLVLASALVLAISGLTKEQKDAYNGCKKNCSTNKMLEKRQCNTDSFAERKNCSIEKTICTTAFRTDYNGCRDGCNNLNISVNLTKSEINKLKRDCQRNCSAVRTNESRSCSFNYRTCVSDAQQERWNCNKAANNNSVMCAESCLAQLNITNGNTNDSNETNDGNETNEGNEINKTFCKRPRPTACTDEVAPVCSNRETTYTNGCYACQDKKVAWYSEGACAP